MDSPTTADYAWADASANRDRIKELERRVELLGRIVSDLCEKHGTTFREEMEYYERQDQRNKDFAAKEQAKRNKRKAQV